MPTSKQYFPFFPLEGAGTTANVPQGAVKAGPIPGKAVDARAAYGGELVWRITNGGALGAPCTIMFQTSPDGTNWFDFFPVASSDLLAGTVTQGPSLTLPRGAMYVRAIAYGNTLNACTVEAGVQLVTAL